MAPGKERVHMAKTEREAKDIIKLIGNILLGGVLAAAVCCALLFCAAAAISRGWLKDEQITQLTVACCALGTACGALWAIRRCGRRVLLVGLLVSAVFFLLLLTVGVLVYRDIDLEQGAVAVLCGSVCGGAAMGMLCGRPKKKKKRK